MKKILLLLVAVLVATTVLAEEYITDVMVIGGTQTEVNTLKSIYTSQGWTVIDQDLNAGCGSGSDYIYLLYKKAGKNEAGNTTVTAVDHFVTDFMIITGSGTVLDNTIEDGRKYHLVPYDGGEHFMSVQGDLNSNCRSGSANIHLYYTTTNEDDRCCAVKSITFNNTQSGAVTTTDGSTGYDLNAGCGSGSDYIYMHTDKAQGWEIYKSSDQSQCYITGFDGPMEALKSVIIPLSVDNAEVLGFNGFDFSGFTNLETINFYNNTVIDWMPSMQNCSKLKHVNTLHVVPELYSGNDMTPYSMTVIPGYGFSRTAIETISLIKVTEIRGNAFEECNQLSNVHLGNSVQIGDHAFANISSNCVVSYPGPLSDWSPMMYMYSPNLYVFQLAETISWRCGWCGGDTVTTHNDLYWTLENNHLKIDCATNSWETNPGAQLITTYNWNKNYVKLLTIEHVDTIAAYKFQEYTNLETLQINSGVRIIGQFAFDGCTKLNTVYLPSCVTKIANGAFRNCERLHNLYFDGTDAQWNDMTRASTWNNYVADDFKAHWHCTVTFDANGHGTAPAPQSIEWSNQDKATEPTAPTADGYYFTGWYTDAECSTPWFFDDIVPGDMTLYAGWNPETVTVLGDVNGDGSVTSADVTCLYNYLLNGDETFIATSDVNNDGFITSADVTVIYNILLGSN